MQLQNKSPIRLFDKKGGGVRQNKRGQFGQSTLFVHMEMSQWNHVVQLIYANKKESDYDQIMDVFILIFVFLVFSHYIKGDGFYH
jgi:hypothetical protein